GRRAGGRDDRAVGGDAGRDPGRRVAARHRTGRGRRRAHRRAPQAARHHAGAGAGVPVLRRDHARQCARDGGDVRGSRGASGLHGARHPALARRAHHRACRRSQQAAAGVRCALRRADRPAEAGGRCRVRAAARAPRAAQGRLTASPEAAIMRPTIVSTAAVLLTLLGLAAGDTLTRPADAQVYPYPYYGCPPGYYYDAVYGCLPAGYYYGPPSYVYPGPSFEFFY